MKHCVITRVSINQEIAQAWEANKVVSEMSLLKKMSMTKSMKARAWRLVASLVVKGSDLIGRLAKAEKWIMEVKLRARFQVLRWKA